MRFAFALGLAVTFFVPLVSEGAESSDPWIVAVRNGEQSGSGVYLKSGLIITAAHLTDANAKMSVRIAGAVLPAQLLKRVRSKMWT